MTRPRLLPWSADGKPAYLRTGDPRSMLSQLADELEEAQLSIGDDVLEGARHVLSAPETCASELRFAATRLSECLFDALRVARSRGDRLEDYEDRDDEESEGTGTTGEESNE